MPDGVRIGVYASISLPCPRSRGVLGPVEVADLDLGAALAQQSLLVVAEGVPPADLDRVVGVEDAAVPRPDLDPDDRAAQHAPEDDVVDRARARPVAGQRRPSASSDSTSWPLSTTFVRVSRFASSIATDRSTKYPPTTMTIVATAVPSA